MAHRTELALKDATKNVKLFDKTVNILSQGLFYFYHNSSVNRGVLQRSYTAFHDASNTGELLIPSRVGGTRWVGHLIKALNSIVVSYPYIVSHLGQLTEPVERVSVDAKSKAKAFLALLKNKNVVCFMMFLLDVLAPLRCLFLQLQETTCVIARQHSAIATTLEAIRKYRKYDGPHLRKVFANTELEGIVMTHCNALTEFLSARAKLIDNLESALQKRFTDFTSGGDISVIQATKIADVKMWPHNWDELADYGDEELNVLLKQFNHILSNADVDSDDAEMEWTLLKKEIHMQDLQNNKIPDWPSIHRRYQHQFPSILAVMDLILTIAPSTAEAERGFSQLKLLKTRLRSRLSQQTLNSCLAIKMLSDDLDQFNPNAAIKHWNESSTQRRRPALKDCSANKQTVHLLELVTGSPSVDEDDGHSANAYDSSQDSDSESDLEESTVFQKLTEQ